ncbi:erythromycin esterase family protein [Oxalobacteraceae bacterium]|nr:erythromycin esterase family protein [Oxalobacteraceae bacterium]
MTLCANAPAASATPADWPSWLSAHTSAVSDQDTGDDYTNLAPFGAAIKDAQVVLLDEQSHGEENVFALKARLVRFLHERHGFDVLALESGLYDADRIWRSADGDNTIRKQAPGNLFYLYANSPAMQGLFDYLQQQRGGSRPLELSGMDGQHTGQYASTHLLGDLAGQLRQAGSRLHEQAFWPQFAELTTAVFAMQRALPDAATQDRYFAFIGQLQAALPASKNYFWQRILVSVDDQARRYWGLRHEQRSQVMGDNLDALITHRYPGKKIIVWGNFVHLNRSGLPVGGNLGSVIARRFGQKAYVVHFTGNQGVFYNFFNDQNTPVVRFPFKTIENLLEQQPGPYNFTNWRDLPVRFKTDYSVQAALENYLPDGLYALPTPQTAWQMRIDGTFYLNKISSVKP